MVDALANSTYDYLIDSVQRKIPPGASYVTDRRSMSFFVLVAIYINLLAALE